jgi:hypothetical protein
MKKKTVRSLEYFLHIMTGVILLLKGYMEMNVGLYFPGFLLTAPAFTVLIIILFWRKLNIPPKHARVACYYIEAPALLVAAYVLHLEGKELHPYFFFIAAMLYPVVGFISTKKFKKLKKPHRSGA